MFSIDILQSIVLVNWSWSYGGWRTLFTYWPAASSSWAILLSTPHYQRLLASYTINDGMQFQMPPIPTILYMYGASKSHVIVVSVRLQLFFSHDLILDICFVAELDNEQDMWRLEYIATFVGSTYICGPCCVKQSKKPWQTRLATLIFWVQLLACYYKYRSIKLLSITIDTIVGRQGDMPFY